jgi:hypothetical protein
MRNGGSGERTVLPLTVRVAPASEAHRTPTICFSLVLSEVLLNNT